MGGAGSRFYKNGYMLPKPLIELNTKPFFYWATMSIKKFIDIKDLSFVILQQHIDDFKLDMVIKEYFPDALISVIPEVLPGPVFTALHGVAGIDDDNPIIFNDCDHMFKCSSLIEKLSTNSLTEDGALLTFESNEPQFSYVKYDGDKIIGTVEKQVVSKHAICGAYIFKTAALFKQMASEYIKDCPYSECFMSGVYNIMCDKGLIIKNYCLDYHVEYGTPKEYELAKESKYFAELL